MPRAPLSAIGTALTKAGEIRDNSAANKYPTFNIHQGKYRLEMSRFLDNPKIPGGSAKAWYLLPAHTHPAITAGSFVGNGFGGGNSQGRNGNTGSTGGGGAHNNMQPSAVVRWLIKV